jgi:superfamily II DNA helicase RecQ
LLFIYLIHITGEKFPTEQCNGTCDNCRKTGQIIRTDYTLNAISIIKIVKEINSNKKKYPQPTFTKLLKICSESKDKESIKYKDLKSKVHSKLTRELFDKLLMHMIIEGYLEEFPVSNAVGFSNDYIREGFNAHVLDNATSNMLFITTRKPGKSTSTTSNNSNMVTNVNNEYDDDDDDIAWLSNKYKTNKDKTNKDKTNKELKNKKKVSTKAATTTKGRAYLSIQLFIHPSIYPSIYTSIYLFIYLIIYLIIYVIIYLIIHLKEIKENKHL